MEDQITIEEVDRALRAADDGDAAELERMLREMPEVPRPSDAEIDAMERELGLPSWRRDTAAFDLDLIAAAVGL